MFPRSLAILLAVLGLYLSAVQAAAQPRAGGWGFGGGRFGFPRGAGAYRYGGPYGRYGYPPGYGRGYPPAYGAPPPRYPAAPPRSFAPPGAPFAGNWRAQQNEVRQAVREGRNIPLNQAIEAVRRRVPGRELDAGLEAGPNGRPVYRLRWAGQDGRRQDYMVDAGTGAVLGAPAGP